MGNNSGNGSNKNPAMTKRGRFNANGNAAPASTLARQSATPREASVYVEKRYVSGVTRAALRRARKEQGK